MICYKLDTISKYTYVTIGHYIKILQIGHYMYICTYKIAIYRRKENHDKFKHSKYQSGNGTANTFVVGLKHKVSREHFIY